MADKDKSSNESNETVVEHPQLKRDRALALFLARNHARQHGKPPPDPADIGPAVFTKMTPEMSEDQMHENLIVAFERMGITVKRNCSGQQSDDD
jgi:hypothetical protein